MRTPRSPGRRSVVFGTSSSISTSGSTSRSSATWSRLTYRPSPTRCVGMQPMALTRAPDLVHLGDRVTSCPRYDASSYLLRVRVGLDRSVPRSEGSTVADTPVPLGPVNTRCPSRHVVIMSGGAAVQLTAKRQSKARQTAPVSSEAESFRTRSPGATETTRWWGRPVGLGAGRLARTTPVFDLGSMLKHAGGGIGAGTGVRSAAGEGSSTAGSNNP